MKDLKIRTRITLISCIMVLSATIAVTGLLIFITYRSMQKEAYAEAYKNAYEKSMDFKNAVGIYRNYDDKDMYVQYYMKTSTDGHIICMSYVNGTVKEIYNVTVFSKEYILNGKYIPGGSSEYRYVKYKGGKYIIFESGIIDNYCLYIIENVSYVDGKIYRIALYGVVITGVVFLITYIILALLLRRQFRPLLELKKTTALMAEGKYDVRVEVNKNDEVGQLGKSFNKMAEAVEKRDSSLKMFMGNLTHELKTPMTAIMGYSQTMLSVNLSEEEKEEALMYINDECSRLERLSKKLMRLLEIENNGNNLELKCIDVKWLFEETGKITHTVIDSKGILFDYSDDGGTIYAEPDLMLDVMVNLVDNAVKASDKGGRVELSYNNNVISVRDYGCGISEEEREKILEPFYMVDKSRSRKSGGAGLGLALVSEILRQQDISLKIDSVVGEGTKISLQFVDKTMNT